MSPDTGKCPQVAGAGETTGLDKAFIYRKVYDRNNNVLKNNLGNFVFSCCQNKLS